MRALLLCAGLMAAVPTWATEITWSVENGFPVIRGAKAFQKFKDEWKPGMSAEGFIATQDADKLRQLLPKTPETLWNPATGLYDKGAMFNRKHTIIAKASGTPPGADCVWFTDGKQYGKASPCSDSFPISLNESVNIELSVKPVGGDEGSTNVFIRTYTILAFGDSFSSGESNPDRPAVGSGAVLTKLNKGSGILRAGGYADGHFTQNADWWDTTCHRSLLSWQSMYAMKMAINDPHRVVRFASFSCSGAEIYDGFFRAQMNPPATDISDRVSVWSYRDGSNYRELISRIPGEEPEQVKLKHPTLNRSQLNAAIHLLCPETPKPRGGQFVRRKQDIELGNRHYYGKVEFDQCQKRMQPVDEVLMSFGGNDVGFSGVVKYSLVPKEVYSSNWSDSSNWAKAAYGRYYDNGKQGWLNLLRMHLKVISPKDGANAARNQLDKLYSDLALSLDKDLGVPRERVKAMLYPNPLQTPLPKACGYRLDMGNVALTEQVVADSFYAPGFRDRAKYFKFYITNADAKSTEDEFIFPLRAIQAKEITANHWVQIDSQPAFKGRSLCSVSVECEDNGVCSESDRFAWTKKDGEKDPSLTPIESFSKWNAYGTRGRSLRTGNDTLMSQARFDKNGNIIEDWGNGSVHPDAKSHALIADSIPSWMCTI
ncbi:hypothetical protein M2D07_015610 [Pseudomonas sp. BGr12]|uniref:hypothetical protein n=1 Tax=Pseudomonas sp. BGr12 TaxID=2936269 RepID=UPI002559E8B3|nr:hypothetical protein [Pseudomonas sp. BJa5]MDL2428445.1 hypothetical protein [Pseudomonas sp. BJa5]